VRDWLPTLPRNSRCPTWPRWSWRNSNLCSLTPTSPRSTKVSRRGGEQVGTKRALLVARTRGLLSRSPQRSSHRLAVMCSHACGCHSGGEDDRRSPAESKVEGQRESEREGRTSSSRSAAQ
jgi:hypothetical protein